MKKDSLTVAELRRRLEHKQRRMSRIAPLLKFNIFLFAGMLVISFAVEDLRTAIIAVFVLAVTAIALVQHNLTNIILKLQDARDNGNATTEGR